MCRGTVWFGEVNPVNQFPRAGRENDREIDRERERWRRRVVNKSSFLPRLYPRLRVVHRFAISRLKPFLFAALVIRVNRSGPLLPSSSTSSPSRSSVISRLARKSEKKERCSSVVASFGGNERAEEIRDHAEREAASDCFSRTKTAELGRVRAVTSRGASSKKSSSMPYVKIFISTTKIALLLSSFVTFAFRAGNSREDLEIWKGDLKVKFTRE